MGIKFDPTYSVHAAGVKMDKGGSFVKDAAGNEYHGDVWPGPCAFGSGGAICTKAS